MLYCVTPQRNLIKTLSILKNFNRKIKHLSIIQFFAGYKRLEKIQSKGERIQQRFLKFLIVFVF
jgi:hypothetical protein